MPKKFEVIENYDQNIFTQAHYSTCIFKGGERLDANVEEVTGIMLDFDEGVSIEQFKASYKEHEWILITSKSHQKEKHGVVCDRFHVLLPTEPFKPWQGYKKWVHNTFTGCDTACNPLGFLYAHPESIVEFNAGKKWEVPTNPSQQIIIPEVLSGGQIKAGGRNSFIFSKANEIIRRHGRTDQDYNKAFEEVEEENKKCLPMLHQKELQNTFESAYKQHVAYAVSKDEKATYQKSVKDDLKTLQDPVFNVLAYDLWGDRLVCLEDNAVFKKDMDPKSIFEAANLFITMIHGRRIPDLDVLLNGLRVFRPVNVYKNYFEKLQWDGIQRAENLFIDQLGVKEDDDYKKYVRGITRVWLRGAYTRGHNPGEQFDICPILYGGQGIGKDTLLRNLHPWVKEGLNPKVMDDAKKTVEFAKACNVAIWSEVKGIKSAESDSIKEWITRLSDSARLAYAKGFDTTFKRSFVCIASTNKAEILRDTTGNRRFPIISLTGKGQQLFWKDKEKWQEYINQVWAEVKEWNDQPIYLTKEQEADVNKISKGFLDLDTAAFIDWCREKEGDIFPNYMDLIGNARSGFIFSEMERSKIQDLEQDTRYGLGCLPKNACFKLYKLWHKDYGSRYECSQKQFVEELKQVCKEERKRDGGVDVKMWRLLQ